MCLKAKNRPHDYSIDMKKRNLYEKKDVRFNTLQLLMLRLMIATRHSFDISAKTILQ